MAKPASTDLRKRATTLALLTSIIALSKHYFGLLPLYVNNSWSACRTPIESDGKLSNSTLRLNALFSLMKHGNTKKPDQKPGFLSVSHIALLSGTGRVLQNFLFGRLALCIILRIGHPYGFGDQPGVLTDQVFNLVSDIRVFKQEGFGVFAALADTLTIIGKPGTGFFDDVAFDAEVKNFAHFGNALAVHDVKFNLTEWRRHLVFHNFNAGLVADHFIALLYLTDTADIEADGSIEFQRIAAGCGFRSCRT